MKRKPTFAKIGSVSGLNPAEDPIGDLTYALKNLLKRCRVPREIRKEHISILAQVDRMQDAHPNEDQMIESLELALEHYAPPYAHFGQADSCEFGFWHLPIDETDVMQLDAGMDHELAWGQDAYLINDHGNVSCGRFDLRGAWHEYWSVV